MKKNEIEKNEKQENENKIVNKNFLIIRELREPNTE